MQLRGCQTAKAESSIANHRCDSALSNAWNMNMLSKGGGPNGECRMTPGGYECEASENYRDHFFINNMFSADALIGTRHITGGTSRN